MPIISQNNILTIPKEIFEASNLKLSKPIYLYNNGNTSWITNKKGKYDCYGVIKLDDNLSFVISNNFVNAFGKNNIENKDFYFCVSEHTIYFEPNNSNFSKYLDYIALKTQIPTELMQVSQVNFNKPVYLYNNSYATPILSNKNYSQLCCLGLIHLDNEGVFTLSENMCKALNLKTMTGYSWVTSDKNIILRKANN